MMEKLGYLALAIALLLFIQRLLEQKRVVVLWGDSITEQGTLPNGFITLLYHLLSKAWYSRYSLQVQGKGGRKVTDLLQHLPQVLALKPAVVVINIGTNDVWHQRFQNGTLAPTFVEVYEQMIQQLQFHQIKIAITTIAAIGEPTNQEQFQEFQESIELYNTHIRQLASTYSLTLIDTRLAFETHWQRLDAGNLTTDGVHLNIAGNQLLANLYHNYLSKLPLNNR
jgi:lysophospholipase L1-like esterase